MTHEGSTIRPLPGAGRAQKRLPTTGGMGVQEKTRHAGQARPQQENHPQPDLAAGADRAGQGSVRHVVRSQKTTGLQPMA